MNRLYVSLCVVVASASAIEVPNSSSGLRNFLEQQTDAMVKVETTAKEVITCNPTGNLPPESDCPGGMWCAFKDENGNLLEQCPDPNIVQEGVCELVTAKCNRSFRPVCGCDRKTYSNNSCTLGVNVLHYGPCVDGEDTNNGGNTRRGRSGRRGRPPSAAGTPAPLKKL